MKWFNYLSIERAATSGVNPACWLHHRSLARTIKKNPYLLANEWICSSIGAYLRLPIPPFALMRKSNASTRYFGSLDYGKKETIATDMLPGRLCECLPDLATGIALFDILIANPDRHEGNVKVDNNLQPTSVELIDQDRALFGCKAGHGNRRLIQKMPKLGFSRLDCSFDAHKIARALGTAAHFDTWVSRIRATPDWFIEAIVEEAEPLGLMQDEVGFCKSFLIHRRNELRTIISENKRFFKGITDWGVLFQ